MRKFKHLLAGPSFRPVRSLHRFSAETRQTSSIYRLFFVKNVDPRHDDVPIPYTLRASKWSPKTTRRSASGFRAREGEKFQSRAVHQGFPTSDRSDREAGAASSLLTVSAARPGAISACGDPNKAWVRPPRADGDKRPTRTGHLGTRNPSSSMTACV